VAERQLIPLSCSLDVTAMAERRAEYETLARTALLHGERVTERQLVLRFAALDGVLDAVHDLVHKEGECCSFLTIDVSDDGDGTIAVEIGSPEGGEATVDAFSRLLNLAG
jgi:hypothetical protein